MVRKSGEWRYGAATLAIAGLSVLTGCTGGGDDAGDASEDQTADSAISASEATTTTAPTNTSSTTAEPSTTTTQPLPDRAAVVVMAGGLTPEFADVVRETDGVDKVAVLQIGQLRLTASADPSGTPVDQTNPGFVIPIDTRTYEDPDNAAVFAPDLADALGQLEPDELVLSTSSAALRRLEVGSTMTFDNAATFRVGAVLPDDVVGSPEAVLVGPDATVTAGLRNPRRVALVDYASTGQDLEQVLLAANDGEGIRVFGGRDGEDQSDRDRAVLAQIRVKEIFGEFAYRPRFGGAVEIDPGWVDANIVSVDLPLLGTTKCHRIYAEILESVLQGLVDDGLEDVIDPAAFQGCWNPRFIGGTDRLSRHAWGIAADINFFNELDGGPGSPVHPELLDRMAAAGVTSGHDWSSPDPGHFEYLTG